MSATTVEGESNTQAGDRLELNGSGDPEADEISTEEVFEILSNTRRRKIIAHLRENGETANIRSLSEFLAAIENDVEQSQVTSKQRMRTYTALRQSHLPKMDRTGVIDFDENSGEVTLKQTATQLEKYLNLDANTESRWRRYYIAIGLVGIALTLGVFADVSVFYAIPDIIAGLTASVAIIAAASAHILLS